MFDRPSFEEFEAKAHAEIDQHVGDMWTHVSTVSRPNYPSAPDPSKPAYMLVAKFCYEPRDVRLGLEQAGVVSNDPTLTIHRGQLRYLVNRGDRFQRCSTGLLYEVTSAQPDTVSGILVNLVQLGEAP
ncbi:hypothetical protein D1O30_06895 [Methylocystis hirsuta]|uniref:Head-tail adaptor protein n=1 Tax=Methylocystis hirsuta TaxID=369798 RepID=A0A3M9XNF6_9HYPH|nr:hypothetical protein D1O30_06895 [Methylocystis hirsuta]